MFLRPRGLLSAANTSLVASLYAVVVLKSARWLRNKGKYERELKFLITQSTLLGRKSARCDGSLFFHATLRMHVLPSVRQEAKFFGRSVRLYTQITIISSAEAARAFLAAINNRCTKAMSTRAARKKQLTLIFHQVSSAPS